MLFHVPPPKKEVALEWILPGILDEAFSEILFKN